MRRMLTLTAATLALLVPAVAAPAASANSTASRARANGSSPSRAIPFGHSAAVEGWKVKVVRVVPEARDSILHTRPPAGYLYEVYTIQATRTASSPESPILLVPVLVGRTKDQRSVDTKPMCNGGTPYNDKVDKGGTVRDSACISIPKNDTVRLALGVGLISQVWFATSKR